MSESEIQPHGLGGGHEQRHVGRVVLSIRSDGLSGAALRTSKVMGGGKGMPPQNPSCTRGGGVVRKVDHSREEIDKAEIQNANLEIVPRGPLHTYAPA